MGVDEFVCFQNIYSYISQQCMLWSNGTFTPPPNILPTKTFLRV